MLIIPFFHLMLVVSPDVFQPRQWIHSQMPVGNVDILSQSEDEGPLVPEPPKVQKGRKRRGSKSPQAKSAGHVDPETALRAILGTPCRCKRTQCMSVFTGDRFHSLLEYRQSFSALHKLDQDHSVP